MPVNAIGTELNTKTSFKTNKTATPLKIQKFGNSDVQDENSNSTTKAVLIGGAVLAAAVAAYFMFRKGRTSNVETPKPKTPISTAPQSPKTAENISNQTRKIVKTEKIEGEELSKLMVTPSKNEKLRPCHADSLSSCVRTTYSDGSYLEQYIFNADAIKDEKCFKSFMRFDKDGNAIKYAHVEKGKEGSLWDDNNTFRIIEQYDTKSPAFTRIRQASDSKIGTVERTVQYCNSCIDNPKEIYSIQHRDGSRVREEYDYANHKLRKTVYDKTGKVQEFTEQDHDRILREFKRDADGNFKRVI